MKRPINKKALIVKCIILCIFLGLTAFTLWRSATALIRYHALDEVYVDAIVCRVEEEWDSDDDKYYDLYIQYVYNGETYTTRYDSTYDEEKADCIGRVVSVQIDSQHPEELVEDILDSGVDLGVASAVTFAISLIVLFAPCREERENTIGLTDEEIRKDLMDKLMRRGGWLSCAVFSGAIVCLNMLYPGRIEGILMVAAAVIGVIGVFLLVRNVYRMILVIQGRYQVRYNELTDKRIDESDDSISYILFVVDGNKKIKTTTTEKKYNAAVVGQQFKAVYLEKEKNPILLYPVISKQ